MIEKKRTSCWHRKDEIKKQLGENATADDVLDLIIGDERHERS